MPTLEGSDDGLTTATGRQATFAVAVRDRAILSVWATATEINNPLLGDVDEGAGDIGEISALSSQFCCEPRTVLKTKVHTHIHTYK